MITLKQHIENNRSAIQSEARQYAKNYNVSMQEALRDVTGEYEQGYFEAADARRHGDWDWGRE